MQSQPVLHALLEASAEHVVGDALRRVAGLSARLIRNDGHRHFLEGVGNIAADGI